MLERGEDIKTIQELLGHKDIGTTLNTYAHVTQKMKAANAAKVENILAGPLKQLPSNKEPDDNVNIDAESNPQKPRLRLVAKDGRIVNPKKMSERKIM